MNLLQSLRLNHVPTPSAISFVGAGGKTTAMFQLARQLLDSNKINQVIVSATTHLGTWQTSNADHHLIFTDVETLAMKLENIKGVILVTNEINGARILPVSENIIYWIHEYTKGRNIPLLIEADGSRAHPLKAPAEHEPPIPAFSELVIHVIGLSAIGKPLNNENIHRAEIYSQRTGLSLHELVTPESVIDMLKHPQGGLKNIQPGMRHVALLNQADSPALKSIGGTMAAELLGNYDAVIVGSLHQETFQAFEKTAGILLAAGSSTRYGSPKQLLDWHGKPFVRHIAETALRAGLWPVVVVSGAHHAEINSALSGLPVEIVQNLNYAHGQSTSIKTGVSQLKTNIGAAIFLLADQPQIPVEVIRALVEAHSRELQSIIAPMVLEERRANPVLFDKITFPDLLQLEGDSGGRAIFSKYKVEYLPWHDDRLLFDVDKPEDYKRLVEDETL